MKDSKFTQINEGIVGLKRVARPFDQADIDGEPVETACDGGIAFFLPSDSSVGTAVSNKALRYGDVGESSFGEDSERERDA